MYENLLPQTPMVDRCLKSADAPHRRAAYLIMAVIVEGCGDYIMTKLVFFYLFNYLLVSIKV